MHLPRTPRKPGRVARCVLRISLALILTGGVVLLFPGLARSASAGTRTLCPPPSSPEVHGAIQAIS